MVKMRENEKVKGFWMGTGRALVSAFVGLFLIGFCGPSWSQNLNLKSYTQDDGLAQSQVLSVYQDTLGYLWVGTYSGLSRYNGHHWKQYTQKEGLSRNYIKVLSEDHLGRVLVGTSGGLNYLENDRFHAFEGDPFLRQCNVEDILRDRQDRVWVATSEGLALLDHGKFRRFTESDGLPSRVCVSLYQRFDGTIWVGTNKGLAWFDGNGFKPFAHNMRLVEKAVPALVEDNQGRFFIASGNQLYVYQDGVLRPFEVDGIITKYEYYCATRDHEGTLWFGTYGEGLIAVDGDHARRLDRNHGLQNEFIRAVYVDSENNLWIGTDFDLEKFTPRPFVAYRQEHGLPHNFVRSLYLSEDETIWIGTRGGVATYTPETGMQPFNVDPFPSEQVFSISKDQKGTLYFGTFRGLVTYRDGNYSTYGVDDGFKVDFIRTVMVDRKDRVWCGAQGLYLFEDGKAEAMPVGHPLAEPNVMDLVEAPDGRIWVATVNGVVLFDPESGETERLSDHNDVTIWDIDLDHLGRLWMGTNGHGLVMVDHDVVTTYTTENGLGNDYVWHVLAATNGDVYAHHNEGLDRLRNGRFTHYTKRDGLADNEGAATACLEDREGFLWFGTGSGLTRFDSTMEDIKPIPPRIHLESVLVDGVPVNHLAENVFERNSGRYDFEYTALHFTKEEDIVYSFRLEGWMPRWSEPSKGTSAPFFNLPPGQYRFMVRSQNSAGLWSEETAEYRFRVLPAFWETAWFKGMMIALALFLIFLIVRWKMWSLQNKKRQLEALVQEKTAALKEANNELLEMQRHLVEAAHRAGMAETATGILHNVGNVLNSMNVSIEIIDQVSHRSKAGPFIQRLSELIDENKDNFSDFVTHNEQGKKLPQILAKTLELIEKNQRKLGIEAEKLQDKIRHVIEIVRTQQAYAKGQGFRESIVLHEAVEDALRLQANFLETSGVRVVRDYDDPLLIHVPKVKLMQVIVNLIKNAAESFENMPDNGERGIWVRTCRKPGGWAVLEILDNGKGIDPVRLDEIFSYGFSTKSKGHGFGLHFCANAMTEMGGRISVDSEGLGKGATFVLEFPVEAAQKAAV